MHEASATNLVNFPTATRTLEDRFLDGCRSDGTRDAYRTDLRDFRAYLRQEPTAATRSNVEGFVQQLMDKGRQPATIARKVASLRSFLRFAVDEGVIDRNPAANARTPRVSDDSPTLGLSSAEARELLDVPDNDTIGLRDRALLSLLLYNALRVSEVIAVQVGDLQDDGGYRVLRVKGKGGKVQKVPMPPASIAAVRDWLDHAGIEVGPVFRAVDKGGRVSEKAFSRQSAAKRIRFLARRAGITKKLSPHSLRHTAITLALDAGMSLRHAQDFARHADPRTTRRYDRNREALNNPCPHAVVASLEG